MTNYIAPTTVRWSGNWTNITGSTTNLLQFDKGIATNSVTL